MCLTRPQNNVWKIEPVLYHVGKACARGDRACGLTGSSAAGDTTFAAPPFVRSAPIYASAEASASFCRLRSRSCSPV